MPVSPFSRQIHLLTCFVTSLLFSLSFVFAKERPNILWIIAEDMGPELRCYGHPEVHSPVIDKLAANGVRLHTSVYEPKDIAKPYPLLQKRTPYGSRPNGVNNFPNPSGPMRTYGREGYIFVYQDVRGRNGSEGTFVHIKVSAAVMAVGGWFEAEDLYGPLKIYESVEQNNPNTSNILVMGPWAHGGWSRGTGDRLGHIQFRSKTSEYYRTHIEGPFLRHWLKDGPDPELSEAYVFETGTHQWRQYDAWPPRQGKIAPSIFIQTVN